MPTLRLFASAREVAGTGADTIEGDTVRDVLDTAARRYGPAFVEVLGTSRIWVNGDEYPLDATVGADDEVAVLPPVSGGAS